MKKNPRHEKQGKIIRKARKKLKLTQEGLSDKSRLEQSYISDIERGKRGVGVKNARVLANSLGISLYSIIDAYQK